MDKRFYLILFHKKVSLLKHSSFWFFPVRIHRILSLQYKLASYNVGNQYWRKRNHFQFSCENLTIENHFGRQCSMEKPVLCPIQYILLGYDNEIWCLERELEHPLERMRGETQIDLSL